MKPVQVDIEPLREDHFASLYDLFDSVCRERQFLVFTSAGSKEQAFAYYRNVVAGGHAHVVAVREGHVIG